MADILVEESVVQTTASACLVDTAAPTFGGITGLTSNGDGSLTAAWAAGSDPSAPISYEVYVKKGTATGLFLAENLALVTSALSARVYALADATKLENSATYYVGVRARDAAGNVDNNIFTLNAISEGVLAGEIVYGVHGVFSINASNQLRASFWATENGVHSTSVLGAARFKVYDEAGATVAGLTQTGLTADANGIYHAAAVSAQALVDLAHYVVEIGIVVDGVEHVMLKGLVLGE